MSSDVVVKVSNISKCFEMYEKPVHRLYQTLFAGTKKFHKEFWALKDISFEVKKGESVGIIGKNGAGKSTLLQIITQTLHPTTGSVEINGRVAALLELGSGFNPEFTGRENVYMNAAILGLSGEETNQKFQQILDFADIGDFIDQPVKTYSSGMMVRLAFAVQVLVEPDILIVDEALAVGDAAFQRKCFAHMDQLKKRGVTLLLVTHDTETVKQRCDRVIFLKDAQVAFDGPAEEGVIQYMHYLFPVEFARQREAEARALADAEARARAEAEAAEEAARAAAAEEAAEAARLAAAEEAEARARAEAAAAEARAAAATAAAEETAARLAAAEAALAEAAARAAAAEGAAAEAVRVQAEAAAAKFGDYIYCKNDFETSKNVWGIGGAFIQSVRIFGLEGGNLLRTPGKIKIEVTALWDKDFVAAKIAQESLFPNMLIGIRLSDVKNIPVYGCNNYLENVVVDPFAKERAVISYTLDLPMLKNGAMFLTVAVGIGNQLNHTHLVWDDLAIQLQSISDDRSEAIFHCPTILREETDL